MGMCQALGELREAVGRYAKRFDPELLSPAEAHEVVSEAAAIASIATTVQSLAAARAADGPAWKETGCRSPAEALARQTGTTIRQARDALDTGRRLQDHPEVADAARSGLLSAAQTSIICEATEADPHAAARLVDAAQIASFAELRDQVAIVKAAAVADHEARRREIHRRRRVRPWTDTDGVWHLHACGNIEDGAQIMAALTPIANDLFRQAHRDGRREPAEAHLFDALVHLSLDATSIDDADATGADGSTAAPPGLDAPKSPRRRIRRRRRRRGAPVKLLVRIDYDTWLRGVALPGETCELVGYGPISVAVVQELVARGDPFVAAILAKGKSLVGVAHLGRAPNAYQQSALEWLYPWCAVEGCSSRIHLERDHRVDWIKAHHTMLDELDMLCSHHHALKTRKNWALVSGMGKRAFVPPTDARHPDYASRRVAGPVPNSAGDGGDVLQAELSVGDQAAGLVDQIDPP
jgi:hypothetical protein